MTTEQRILHRLPRGATPVHDRLGISFDLPGEGMMWSKHSFIAGQPDVLAALEAIGRSGTQRERVKSYEPLVTPSVGLKAMIAELEARA